MSRHTKKLVEEILSGLAAEPLSPDEEVSESEDVANEPIPNVDTPEQVDESDEDTLDEVEETETLDLLSDLETLRTQYPDLPLEELASDELFIRFARGKGNDFRTICADFDSFIDSVRQSIIEEEQEKRKLQRRTGGGSRKSVSNFGLSRSQLDFLDAWNRDNPDYAMTPKQYAHSLRND